MSRLTKRAAAWSAFVSLLLLAATAQAAQLPDFTGIVKQVSPAVVHVQATYNGNHQTQHIRAYQNGQRVPDQQMPDILRHFFGMPGMPGGQGAPFQQPAHMSVGSGFIISSDGYILTNRHVVAKADKVIVKLKNHRIFKAKVVGTDKPYDIALLKIDASNLPTVNVGNSESLRTGQWVLAIGSPFDFDDTVTQGIISNVGRSFGPADQMDVPFIQTDVPINPGNSGGPLLNLDGQVVGINSQIYSKTGGYMGVSFSIPINVAMNAVQQLKSKGFVSRGMIGVQLEPVNYDKARALGMDRAIGALVNKVLPGKPADKAGVQVGDVIIAFNGQEVDSVADLPPMVAMTKPGTKATFTVLRNGKHKTLHVTIGAMPHDTSGSNMFHGGSSASGAGKLGFHVKALTSDQRQELDLKPHDGVMISQITGRQAAAAQLQAGDVVLMVGQRKVGSVAAFNKAIRHVKAGGTVLLLVRGRSGQAAFVTIEVPDHSGH